MGIRKKAPAPNYGSALASLDTLAALPLDAATVATVGELRAAHDAVKARPEYARSFATAQASKDQIVIAAHATAAGNLARRSAEAHAARFGPSFIKADPAPF